jgi:hypothetical protein
MSHFGEQEMLVQSRRLEIWSSAWFALAGLLVCISAFAASAGTTDTVSQRKTLRIGYIADEAPFSSALPDANPTGYAIDLCGKVADEVEHAIPTVKREYVKTTLGNGFEAVEGATPQRLTRLPAKAVLRYACRPFRWSASDIHRRYRRTRKHDDERNFNRGAQDRAIANTNRCFRHA